MSRTDDRYLKQLQARYRKASKNEKTVILDEYVKTTGYHRKHATAVLNGRRERVRGPIRRPRRAQYGVEEANALATLAGLFDNICSKRLRAAMDVELPRLYQASVLSISATCYEKLLRVKQTQPCSRLPPWPPALRFARTILRRCRQHAWTP